MSEGLWGARWALYSLRCALRCRADPSDGRNGQAHLPPYLHPAPLSRELFRRLLRKAPLGEIEYDGSWACWERPPRAIADRGALLHSAGAAPALGLATSPSHIMPSRVLVAVGGAGLALGACRLASEAFVAAPAAAPTLPQQTSLRGSSSARAADAVGSSAPAALIGVAGLAVREDVRGSHRRGALGTPTWCPPPPDGNDPLAATSARRCRRAKRARAPGRRS